MSEKGRDNLWAPWRLGFMRELASGGQQPKPGCFFCGAAAEDATTETLEAEMVLHRGEHALLLMNRYPYVNGHVLVAPRRHVATLNDLETAERHAVMDGVALAAQAVSEAMNAQGYNVGFNVGKCAGAAVPGHIHAHVVPRWHGDTNFMELLGGVKVIPQALEDSYATIRDAVERLI